MITSHGIKSIPWLLSTIESHIIGLAAVEFFSEVPYQGLRNRVGSQYLVGERDRVCRNGVSQNRVCRKAFGNQGWAIEVFRLQVRLEKILRCVHPVCKKI